jgi:hypothetical protein
LRYRSLFGELLHADDGQAEVTAKSRPGSIVGQRAQRAAARAVASMAKAPPGHRCDQPKGPRCPVTGSESAQDKAPTTEQIAAARAAGSQSRTSAGQHRLGNAQTGQPTSAMQTAVGSDLGAVDQPPAQLLEGDELRSILAPWMPWVRW